LCSHLSQQIRAIDLLAADLLADFHPIAIAYALLPQEDFLLFARREVRGIRYITRDSILEKYVTDFLSAQKLDPQSDNSCESAHHRRRVLPRLRRHSLAFASDKILSCLQVNAQPQKQVLFAQ
jgi:hypothetical protein